MGNSLIDRLSNLFGCEVLDDELRALIESYSDQTLVADFLHGFFVQFYDRGRLTPRSRQTLVSSGGAQLSWVDQDQYYVGRRGAQMFVHKDLTGFLAAELKRAVSYQMADLFESDHLGEAEVMHRVEIIRGFRELGLGIIHRLGEHENAKKELWLRRKQVVSAQLCVTLCQVPLGLYTEVATNEAQHDEWVRLFGIDRWVNSGYAKPLTLEFLKANDKLPLDTRFFDAHFKWQLYAAMPNFDDRRDGLLVHSENFGALRLLEKRYQSQVKCIYIDPPYNTGNDDSFAYADNYHTSAWLTMFRDRLEAAAPLLGEHGLFACHVDEHEHWSAEWLIRQQFGDEGDMGKLIWDKRNPKGDAKGIASQHEYLHFATNRPRHIKDVENAFVRDKENAQAILERALSLIDKAGGVTKEVRAAFKEWLGKQEFTRGEKAYSMIDDQGRVYRPVSMAWPNKKKPSDEYFQPLFHPNTGKPCAVPARGWRNPPATMQALIERDLILFGADEKTIPNRKYFLEDNQTQNVASLYYMAGSDDGLFADMGLQFENPKPLKAALYFLSIGARPKDSIVLDYFAGSGTTGHGVIESNRGDGGSRKYVLVEMGDYFHTTLKDRMLKACYSTDWKDAHPVSSTSGVSHCFEYLTLESFEDPIFASVRELRYAIREPSLFQGGPCDVVTTFNYLLGLRVKTVHPFIGDGVVVVEGWLPSGQEKERSLVLWCEDESSLEAAGPWLLERLEAEQYDLVYTNRLSETLGFIPPDFGGKCSEIEEAYISLLS